MPVTLAEAGVYTMSKRRYAQFLEELRMSAASISYIARGIPKA